MSIDDIEVRITASGEIHVKINGENEERIRNYHQFLEETFGPAKVREIFHRPDWDQPASQSESEQEKEITLDRK